MDSVKEEIKKLGETFSKEVKKLTQAIDDVSYEVNTLRKDTGKVEVKNLRDIPIMVERAVTPPKSVSVEKSSFMESVFGDLARKINARLEVIIDKVKGLEVPTSAENPVAVRLSDGKKFYEAVTQVFSTGGAANVPKVTSSTTSQPVVPVANHDGTPLSVVTGTLDVTVTRVNYTGAQTNTAIVSASAGSRIAVLGCDVLVDHACTVDVQARVGFGASTTPTGDGTILSHPGIAAGSGVVKGWAGGIIGVGADGEDLRITCSVPTSGSIDVVVSYQTI